MSPTTDAPRTSLAELISQNVLVVSIPEGGAFLGLSRTASYRAADEGNLPTIRTSGRRRVVPVAALRALLEGRDLG